MIAQFTRCNLLLECVSLESMIHLAMWLVSFCVVAFFAIFVLRVMWFGVRLFVGILLIGLGRLLAINAGPGSSHYRRSI